MRVNVCRFKVRHSPNILLYSNTMIIVIGPDFWIQVNRDISISPQDSCRYNFVSLLTMSCALNIHIETTPRRCSSAQRSIHPLTPIPRYLRICHSPLRTNKLLRVPPTLMSHTHPTGPESPNFQLIFSNALKAHDKYTKNDLLSHPLTAQL